MVERSPTSRMNRSSLNQRLAFTRAAWAAIVLAILDAVIGYAQRGVGSTTWTEQLVALRFCVALLLIVMLGAYSLFLLARRRFDLSESAFLLAMFVALAVAIVDVDFMRWEAVRGHWSAARTSGERGCIAGLAAYLLLARRKGPSEAAGVEPRSTGFVGVVCATIGLALVALAPILTAGGGERAERQVHGSHRIPRVILIVVDTLRADALSYASDTAPRTPAIDRFASTAHVFEAARTPGAWTLPSMASLLTGVSPLVHGATTRFSALPRGLPTLAERLADDGYRTAAIGHNFVLSKSRKLDGGFDTYAFAERPDDSVRSIGNLRVLSRQRETHVADLNADQLNQLAFEWIEAHREEDFFLWLHYYDPHLVYEPPVDLRPDGAPPKGLGPRYGHDLLSDIRAGYHVPSTEEREWAKALYDGEVRAVDRALGALFERLSELELLDDSLVVLTSDHGEEFWEHEGFEHGHTLYDEVARVPLVIKLPRQAVGTTSRMPTSLESISATVLSLCGIEYDAALLSASTLFAPDGAPLDDVRHPRATTGTCYFQDRLAVLFGGWKYIRWLATGAEELYDLNGDPGERVSLVALRPDELAEGRRRCDEVIAEAGALRRELGLDAAEASIGPGELRGLADIGYAAGDE